MRKVFKYNLGVGEQQLVLPTGADILAFNNQHDRPVLWALVDPDAPTEARTFRITGTGHVIEEKPRELSYIGTAQFNDGALVLHLFEILRGR